MDDIGFPEKTLMARAGAIAMDRNMTLNEDADEQEREVNKYYTFLNISIIVAEWKTLSIKWNYVNKYKYVYAVHQKCVQLWLTYYVQ